MPTKLKLVPAKSKRKRKAVKSSTMANEFTALIKSRHYQSYVVTREDDCPNAEIGDVAIGVFGVKPSIGESVIVKDSDGNYSSDIYKPSIRLVAENGKPVERKKEPEIFCVIKYVVKPAG